jgi:pyridoxal phosphate enzyme (YggS family)
MSEIAENLAQIKAEIAAYEKKYGRVLGSTQLIAVTKGQAPEKIKAAFEAGQRDFAENYCQEFLEKRDFLRELSINWHFIGKIQSNKTREIAENFAWVHSVDREKIAHRLNEQRPEGALKLNVCIEVNISKDPNKSGVSEDEVFNLAKSIAGLGNLKLRGLMTILHSTSDFTQQLALFQKMHKLSDNLNKEGFALDTLSMGMSGDFEAAIAAGATQVRIGQAIFK